MAEENFVKGSELDRLITVVSRQIDQGFVGVDTRITELSDQFTQFEQSVTGTLRDHGEKIAVLTDRSNVAQIPLNAAIAKKRRAVVYGTGAGTIAVFLWSALKSAATWFLGGSGGHK